ncbi:MAG: type III-A CRISPR-associated protein Cas10/Csm1 [Chlorobiaceae bacterium]|nr:type III-A CRISPR-associated protein Cas10/Csm1 [Chlorobiaceae bacterium]
MSNQHPVIQLGLELLREKSLSIEKLALYREAFRLLDIDISKQLSLNALKSVFSNPDDSSARYFKPSILNPEVINYPIDELASGDFSEVCPPVISDEHNELTLLEKYGSFVAVDSYPQTPVYDLFKTAAAIQDCLEKGEGDQRCLLVGCDFSGIQDTVYTITSKGALKTLRARSFMLELLCEHIITEILDVDVAGRHAVIYSGGGGFALLLPNKKDLEENIEKYFNTLNEWALKEFSGRLFVAIDVLGCSVDDLKDKEKFQLLRQRQADRLDKLKRRKFIGQLDKLFEPNMPKQVTIQTECQITRRDDLDDEQMRDIALPGGDKMTRENKIEDGRVWVSESCFHQFKMGDWLIDNKNTIYRYDAVVDREKKENFGTLVLPGIDGSGVFYTVHKVSNAESAHHWKINFWDDSSVFQYANYVRKYGDLSNYAKEREQDILKEEGRDPKNNDTASFSGLAASSCGADLIGALRMDVDNMGNMFSGIEQLTELSTKSRMLNIFFKVYLNQICIGNLGVGLEATDIVGKNYQEKNQHGDIGRNVSVIYSGGDDLFILGAWDETTELAFDIHRSFALFTGGSLDAEKNIDSGGWGISGGLTLHHPKFPLYQMAKKSGEAESVAKYESGQKKKDGLKNRIALFYADHLMEIERNNKMERINKDDDRLMLIIDWKQFNTVKEIVKFFVSYSYKSDNDMNRLFMKNLPNSVTYTLLDITHEWHEKGILYIPYFLWFLKKHTKDFDEQPNGLRFFKQNFILTKFNILHLPLTWIELLKRGG